jgi:hypothetical protein
MAKSPKSTTPAVPPRDDVKVTPIVRPPLNLPDLIQPDTGRGVPNTTK